MCVRKLSALFDGLSGAAPGLNVGFILSVGRIFAFHIIMGAWVLSTLRGRTKLFLMKLVFQFVTDPTPMWVQLLRANYKWRGINGDWPSVRRCSQIWKGLFRSVTLVDNRDSLLIVPSIIYYIAELLTRAWSVKLCHIGLKGNGVADWMAKNAAFDDFICHRFLSPPVEVEMLLISEASH
ncbi:hypothetical protein V6N13_103351 [Hibiscus sabdariffa]